MCVFGVAVFVRCCRGFRLRVSLFSWWFGVWCSVVLCCCVMFRFSFSFLHFFVFCCVLGFFLGCCFLALVFMLFCLFGFVGCVFFCF